MNGIPSKFDLESNADNFGWLSFNLESYKFDYAYVNLLCLKMIKNET